MLFSSSSLRQFLDLPNLDSSSDSASGASTSTTTDNTHSSDSRNTITLSAIVTNTGTNINVNVTNKGDNRLNDLNKNNNNNNNNLSPTDVLGLDDNTLGTRPSPPASPAPPPYSSFAELQSSKKRGHLDASYDGSNQLDNSNRHGNAPLVPDRR